MLACLPGVTPELAQAIISYRSANGYFPNIAWLLKVPDLSREIFKQLAKRVTARSETFRIISEGKVNSTGARQPDTPQWNKYGYGNNAVRPIAVNVR